MDLILRRDKGSKLTHDELDDNQVFIDAKIAYKILPPTSSDDESKGFQVGSEWKITINGDRYECTDATVNNAVWQLMVENTAPAVSRNHFVSNSAPVSGDGVDGDIWLQISLATSTIMYTARSITVSSSSPSPTSGQSGDIHYTV